MVDRRSRLVHSHGQAAGLIRLDFLGHGRNPLPLTGDITDESGATTALLEELRRVVALRGASSTAEAPRTLPIIVGEWEGFLADEARRRNNGGLTDAGVSAKKEGWFPRTQQGRMSRPSPAKP